MADIAIQIMGLGKQYRIGAKQARYKTLRDTLAETATAPFRRGKAILRGQSAEMNQEKIWALKDVSFEVKAGEAIGIIGNNGAGKSTLLKILSRITEPSEGHIDVFGRVGSLLEVGTGFHPELTGRENIYLNGAILGMRRREIDQKFDEIVAFAEVEKFVDTPVKRFSSGMYLRLAFAVAAHLEPEILLIDEVLAVGDAAFQKKCLGKMEGVVRQGRTILFVSHNLVALASLCETAVWLKQGMVEAVGESSQIIAHYLQGTGLVVAERLWPDLETAPGNEKVRIRSARVYPASSRTSVIDVRTQIAIEFEYWNLVPDAYLDVGFHLHNRLGVLIMYAATFREPNWHDRPLQRGLYRSKCYIPGDLLNDGNYSVQLSISRSSGTSIYKHPDLLEFEVLDSAELRGGFHAKWPGAVRLDVPWETEFLD